MQTINQKKGRWTLKQVIFLAIIAIFFGFIYEAWSFAYYALAATPLKAVANDATIGVWLMAGPLAGVLLQRIGASTLGELLAATIEMLLFSSWGVGVLISGLIQGIGSELGFTLTGYKNWGRLGLTLSVITSTLVTFCYDLFASGYAQYSLSFLLVLFCVRLISIAFFSGVLVYWIKLLVEKSGLIK
ncbi:ABC transporter ATP-binding protein [Weissella oryzae SG25]|uniref:ABC transporter ATP-binding protein n=1 Tax=Weissella oryzae (strain DSM 25784 / JCM 18191 / LMG 30913 / SG25) TaxID=1329250 RepID=A0A069CRV0_WEIOS|nr:ECF transporter S component [Weissella oryzae]GAK30520.1 ABC transporter ATP-binding protein [Weissella oryzae SG25]